MSRTYRNKKGRKNYYGSYTYDDALTESEWISGINGYCGYYLETKIDRHSKEGKKIIAQFHSESKNWGNSHGPSWFITEYMQRPYRCDAKNQIYKAMKDDDFEVIIPDKPKREYWD